MDAGAWAMWMVQMSWQVALLAAIVWCIARFAPRSSATFRFALWALVFIKLVIPPTLAAPWSAGTAVWHVSATMRPEFSTAAPLRIGNLDIRPAGAADREYAAGTAIRDTAAAGLPRTWSIAEIAMLGWAVVAAALLGALVLQYARFKRRVLRGATPAPDSIQPVVNSCRHTLGIRRPVRVLTSENVSTPFVFGVLAPVILLPPDTANRYTAEHLRNILLHELGHIRRHDVPMNWAMALLVCLYWFHPAVWLASLCMRREREMACDDLVLQHTNHDAEGYASTIVEVASKYRQPAVAGTGFVGLLELADNMLARVRAIGDDRRTRRAGWRAAMIVGAVALLFGPMAVWTPAVVAQAPPDADAVVASAEAEIDAHYSAADAEVQEYIRWTARNFGRSGLWLPAEHFDDLGDAERAEKVAYYADALDGEYGRHLCEALNAAGVLGDKKLLPGVLKAATYHRDDRDYDCRPKWMAVAALGRIGEPAAVPDLVYLVDHGNQNTRMWARASLARITGAYFSDDKQAWADWWNASHEPKVTAEHTKPWNPPAGVEVVPGAAQAAPPEVVQIQPAFGQTNVDPATTEIVVEFDQDMADGFSWTGGGDVFPKTTGKPVWTNERTCVLPVQLEPGKFYRLGINSKSHKNFKSKGGAPARNRVVYFVTDGASEEELAKAATPTVVAMTPANGASGIDPGTATLTVTFSQPMADGFSWVDFGANYPKFADRPVWNEDKTVVTAPVALEPRMTYRVGLNSGQHANFQSVSGIPLEPVVWTFATSE